MKSITNKILVLILTGIFIVTSVGINVFSHFCSHCHVSYYSVDVAPIENSCQCEHNCECHCKCMQRTDNTCGMHSHEHEFYHIDDSYNTPERLSPDNLFFIVFLDNFLNSQESDIKTKISEGFIIKRITIPDIISLNCTFLC